MKGFKRLALAAAVASLPAAGLAMQPMGDAELGDVTGQDGIILDITADVDINLGWEDTSGVTGVAAERGMVYMPGFNVSGDINVQIDAGSTTAGVGGGVLQVAVTLPNISVTDFEVYVRGSSNAGADYDATDGLGRFAAVAADPGDPILSLGSIEINDLGLTLQLGEDAAQFALIETAAAISIDLTDLVIVDRSAGNGGSLHIAEMSLEVDPDGTTIGIDDDPAGDGTSAPGLVISMPNLDPQSIGIMNVGFGDGTARTSGIGNIYTSVTPNAATQIVVRGR